MDEWVSPYPEFLSQHPSTESNCWQVLLFLIRWKCRCYFYMTNCRPSSAFSFHRETTLVSFIKSCRPYVSTIQLYSMVFPEISKGMNCTNNRVHLSSLVLGIQEARMQPHGLRGQEVCRSVYSSRVVCVQFRWEKFPQKIKGNLCLGTQDKVTWCHR